MDIGNKVPIIRKNRKDQMFDAGFLNRDTNQFEHDMDVKCDEDIDTFLDKYDLSSVSVSKL